MERPETDARQDNPERRRLAGWLASRRRPRRLVALTGAGISAESGLPTFRGSDRLWRGAGDPSDLFTPELLAGDPLRAWEMYDALRARCAAAEPNAGHRALAELGRRRHFTLVTQNIDGLHQRAGSEDVVELHGTLWRLRCDACRARETNRQVPLPELPPRCADCGHVLRPDIVLYSESLPEEALSRAILAAEQCDLMLVVGTSGVVYPAAALPGVARAAGAAVLEINPESTPLANVVDFSLRATAADALPWVVELLAR